MYSMLNSAVKDAGLNVAYASLHMETMGDRIKRLREAQNLTQTELGELCGGVTRSAVSQWEDGSTTDIKLRQFLALCDALKTDPHYLVYGPDRAPDGEETGSTGRFRRPGAGRPTR
jgi:transcriptional regulator with XRE-family HTH domain